MTTYARMQMVLLLSAALGFLSVRSDMKTPHAEEVVFSVGFRKITLDCPDASDPQKNVRLILNLWYPTPDTSKKRIDLMEFLYNNRENSHLKSDSVKAAEIADLGLTLEKWFGAYEASRFKQLATLKSKSQLDARFYNQKFPLILGRLRVFSTSLTSEFLASRGYVVCMLNGVEDYPPDNETLYLQQVENEIRYFHTIREHLEKTLTVTSRQTGLLGFSGNGVSPFLAPMYTKDFTAVALLESGVFLDDIHAILSRFKYYVMSDYNADICFMYNKQRFEQLNMQVHFDSIGSNNKHLILVDEPGQHHWDFATEGTLAAQYLNNRDKAIMESQPERFAKINNLLLAFYDATLKKRETNLSRTLIID